MRKLKDHLFQLVLPVSFLLCISLSAEEKENHAVAKSGRDGERHPSWHHVNHGHQHDHHGNWHHGAGIDVNAGPVYYDPNLYQQPVIEPVPVQTQTPVNYYYTQPGLSR